MRTTNHNTQYAQLNLFELKNDFNANIIKFPNHESEKPESLYVSEKAYEYADTLYWKTRLIAKAIYQKHHWDDSQIIEAAKIIYPYIGYKTNVNTVNNRVDIPLFVSEQKQQQLGLNGKSDQTYCIPIYFRMEQKEYYKRFLILSDSKELYRHYTDVYHNKKSSFARYSYLSKEYLLGFATIIRDFFEQCKKNTVIFSNFEVRDLFKGLVGGRYSSNYNFYEYSITNKDIIKKWRKESHVDIFYTTLQDAFGGVNEDGSFGEWNQEDEMPALVNYFEEFLSVNYKLVVENQLSGSNFSIAE